MKITTTCLLLILAGSANASNKELNLDSLASENVSDTNLVDETFTRVRFGGWSKHLAPLSEITKRDIQYNETHNGFGLERMTPLQNDRYWGYGVMYMKDSFKTDTLTLALSYGRSFNPFEDVKFTVGLYGGLQYRSYILTMNDYYQSTERITVPFIAPEFTASYKDLGVSLAVFPSANRINGVIKLEAPVLFAQFFYDF